MSVFSREARGKVSPDRSLAVPHRAFGVVVDEEAQELFVTIQHPPAVLVWPKMAEGQNVPLRILEGNKTLLAEPQGMALDPANQLAIRGQSRRDQQPQLRPGMATGPAARRLDLGYSAQNFGLCSRFRKVLPSFDHRLSAEGGRGHATPARDPRYANPAQLAVSHFPGCGATGTVRCKSGHA